VVVVYLLNELHIDSETDSTGSDLLVVGINEVLLNHVGLDPFSSDGLRSLNRKTQSSVPNQTRQDTNGSGNTEQDGVVFVFLQTEVLEQDTRVRVDVGPRVLSFALFSQYIRDNFIESRDQLEHGVLRQVLQSKLTLAGVTRICLSQNGVAVSRNDLTTLE